MGCLVQAECVGEALALTLDLAELQVVESVGKRKKTEVRPEKVGLGLDNTFSLPQRSRDEGVLPRP